MSGFHLCAVHADLPSFHCSVKSCFWSMGGQKCTWCSTYGLISGVYNGVHVSPSLLEMPWFVRNHSRRGEKSSFCGHISKDSPQGTPWVHKEGIYAESVQTKRVRDTGGAGSRTTVQETQLRYSHPTGLPQLKDDNSCKQMGTSNTDVFSKTGSRSSSNSCAGKAMS